MATMPTAARKDWYRKIHDALMSAADDSRLSRAEYVELLEDVEIEVQARLDAARMDLATED